MQEQIENCLDVIPGSGKGKSTFGNKNLIQLAKDNLETYEKANTKEKGDIAALIVSAIQEAGGRFLVADANGYLVEMTNREAKLKTQRCFNGLKHRKKVASTGNVSEGTNTTAVAAVPSNPAIIPGAGEGVRATLPILESGIMNVAVADPQDAMMPDAAGTKTPIEAEDNSYVNAILDGMDSDIPELADNIVEESFNGIDMPEGCFLEDFEEATLNMCHRSAMTPVLIAANLKFNEEKDMHKIKFVPRLKVKDDRTYMGSVMDNIPHGRGVMTYQDGRVVCGDWYV